MHQNIWNMKSNKERFSIFYKTESQKRHLESILSIKSRINHQRLKFKDINSIESNESKRNKINTIANFKKLQQLDSSITKKEFFFPREKFQLNSARSMKLKRIDTENQRIYQRLTSAVSTIKREDWIKRNKETLKYKENLNRTKYLRPDYSEEACKKMLNNPSKFRLLKKFILKSNKILAR